MVYVEVWIARKKSMTALSVAAVVPVFNKASTLPDIFACLEANRDSAGPGFVASFIDDGSTDDSWALVEAWALDKDWVVASRQANQGAGAARNAAVRATQASLLAFLDADDVWFPDHAQALWSTWQKHPEACLLSSSYERWVNGVRIRPPFFMVPDEGVVPFHFLSAAWGRMYAGTSSTGMPRAVFDAIGGFDVRLRNGQDRALWAEAALRGPVVRAGRVGAVWRTDTTNSLMSNAFTNRGMMFEHWLEERLEAIQRGDVAHPIPSALVQTHMREALAQDLFRFGGGHAARGEVERAEAYKAWLRRLGRGDLADRCDRIQLGDSPPGVLSGPDLPA